MRLNHEGQDQSALWDQPDDRRPRRPTHPQLPDHRPIRPMEHQELWNIDDVANYLGVPKQTVYSWRTTGYGPQGFRVGKHLRWRATTVITWALGLERNG